MQTFIGALLIVVLAGIVVSDFKHREISLYLLLASIVISVVFASTSNGILRSLQFAGINSCIVLLQLVCVYVYFAIKNRGASLFIDKYIGAGDLVFYLALVFMFSPVIFLVFNIGCCLAMLLVFAIRALVAQSATKTVPLAGCYALCLSVVLLYRLCFNAIDLYNDSYIYSLLVH